MSKKVIWASNDKNKEGYIFTKVEKRVNKDECEINEVLETSKLIETLVREWM